MKKIITWTLALLALAAIAFLVLFPVFARPRNVVYHRVLENQSGMTRWKTAPFFLLVAWFQDGDLNWGRECAVSDSGSITVIRLVPSGTQGSLQKHNWQRLNKAVLQTLRQLTTLPPGLYGPDAIPHSRLLIVSLRHAAQWQTQYYDRQSLPPSLQPIAELVHTLDH